MGTPFAHKDRSAQKDWPKGVHEISPDDFVRMGVDRSGLLYWDGKPVSVVSVRRFSLSLGQWLVALAAFLGGIGGAAQGWNAGHDYGCKVGWFITGCANPTQK